MPIEPRPASPFPGPDQPHTANPEPQSQDRTRRHRLTLSP